MNKIKSAAVIALAIFMAGIFATATAQKQAKALSIPHPLPIVTVLSGTYNVNLDAVQVSIGAVDSTSGTTYGWTWSGKTNSDLTGYMFVSLNFAAPDRPLEGGDRIPKLHTISGGSWSKVIYTDGVYAGTIYGSITGGEVTWDPRDQTSHVNLQLTTDHGTEAFVGASGTGTFVGVVDQFAEVPTVTGVMTLEF